MGNMDSLRNNDIADGSNTQLYASNFNRENYGFAGWSTDPEAGAKINNVDRPTIYGPNETITVSERLFPNSHRITLYAVWVPKSTIYTMQTFSSSDLVDEPVGYVLALEDERDGDTYSVAKLADGNFWMIENLRIDSDANWNESLSAGFAGEFIGLAESENNTFTNNTTPNSKYSSDGSTIKTLSGENIGYLFPRYNNTNTKNRSLEPISGDDNLYLYGNYYSFTAANANTTGVTETGKSICAKGWHMPTGYYGNGNDASFAKIAIALGKTPTDGSTEPLVRQFPYNIVFSGQYPGDAPFNRSITSNLWTSQSQSAQGGSLFLSKAPSTYMPGSRVYDKFVGLAVRCIAD